VVALLITGTDGAMFSVIVLPVATVGIADPPKETASPLETCTAADGSVVEPAIVNARVATTPFDIVLEFVLHTAQVDDPGVLLQLIDPSVPLPALTLSALMSLVG